MEFTITKEQIERLIKMAEHGSTNVIKADLKNWFPEAFEKELKIGKWYKYTPNGNIIYCSKIGHDGTLYGYGFISGQFKIYEDEKSGYCVCNSLAAKSLIQATDEEVEEAIIAEAKRRGYKKGVTCIFGVAKVKRTISTNKIKWDTNCIGEWRLRMGADIIFTNGRWNKIIPEEKTTISKEKALKILAKKLKISPENIEIK